MLVLLFLVSVIVIYISEKKKKQKEKQNFFLQCYCSLAAAVLLKIELFVELGFYLLYPEVKRRSEQD